MSKAIPEKNAFAGFRRHCIPLMRRKQDNANTSNDAKKRIIKGLTMQARVWGHINNNRGRGVVND